MPDEYVNKIEVNGRTLIDLTSDTVTADKLLQGKTAHLASGEPVVGTLVPVTGVKGDAENTYRTGNVNITPANIGAAPIDHTQASNTITAMTGYSKPQATSAITATDTLNEAIGKLEKGLDGAGGGLQPGNVDLSVDSVTLTNENPTATITLSNATGAVTVTKAEQDDLFTMSFNNGKITLNKTNNWGGNGSLIIIVAASNTYSSTVISVPVVLEGVIFGTWSDGSDEAIASMIQAHRDGLINLKDYWAEGDIRTIINQDTTYITKPTLDLVLSSSGGTNPFSILVNTGYKAKVAEIYTRSGYYYLKNIYDNVLKVLQCIPDSLLDMLLEFEGSVTYEQRITTKVTAGGYYIEALYNAGINVSDASIFFRDISYSDRKNTKSDVKYSAYYMSSGTMYSQNVSPIYESSQKSNIVAQMQI